MVDDMIFEVVSDVGLFCWWGSSLIAKLVGEVFVLVESLVGVVMVFVVVEVVGNKIVEGKSERSELLVTVVGDIFDGV